MPKKTGSLIELGEALGMTPDQVIDRAIERLVGGSVEEYFDWDDGPTRRTKPSPLAAEVESRVQAAIDAAVDKLAEETVVPKAEELIRGFVIQKTNGYGEAKGEPVQFTDYLVKRAEDWLNEPVNYNGQAKAQVRYGDTWRADTTRFAAMMDRHIGSSLSIAIEKIYKAADEQVAGGLKKAVLEKLAELTSDIKITIDTAHTKRANR